MISAAYNFLVLNFCTQGFLWGGSALLENWIQEGDEQGNVPVKAFVFLSIVFGLIFFGAKLLMNDRVNMVLSIQKFFGHPNKMFRFRSPSLP